MDAGNSPDKRFMAQINVTPLVDVMLVLLIIFMVTAPMMQAGIDVNLPRVEAQAISPQDDEPLVVSIDRGRRIYISDKALKPSELRVRLEAINRAKSGRMVLLKADESVPYGYIMSTMADIRKAGIEKIGMMTEPAEGGK